MRKSSLYQILIAPVIISAVIIYVAFYSIGVVEKHIASDAAKEYISSLSVTISEDNIAYKKLTETLAAEYELKTQALSVLISQMPLTLSEDMTPEELRIASGADEIMMTDRNGLIIFSTTPESVRKTVDKDFRKGLNEKSYCSSAVRKTDDGGFVFEVAVSRRTADGGLVIAEFVNSTLNESFVCAGDTLVMRRGTMFSSGTTAMVNLSDNRFIAHSNPSLAGTESVIPKEYFRQRQGYFSFRYTHVPSFVFYSYYNQNTVIMTVVSKEYVYTKRTLVLVWLIVLDFTVMLTCFLSARSYRKNN